MADLILESPDLVTPLPADRAPLQKMRDHQLEHLVVLQAPREPSRQGF
jgi:hypothetical protein